MSPPRARTASSTPSAPPASCRSSKASSRSTRKARTRPTKKTRRLKHRLPAVYRGRDAALQGHPAGTALHRAAAALQRSHAGQAPGSGRRRPAVHLRVHPLHHSGARVRQEGRRPLHAHRTRHGGDGPSARELRRHLRREVHGADGRGTRRNRRRQARLARRHGASSTTRFDQDLKHAEEHMTDIKRMEKPTDLICEKCGKPLVIKWGKHGSFHRLHRLSGLFHRRARKAIWRKVQKEIAVRQRARAQGDRSAAGKDSGAVSRDPRSPGRRTGEFVVALRCSELPKAMATALKKLEEADRSSGVRKIAKDRSAPGQDSGPVSPDERVLRPESAGHRGGRRPRSWQRKEDFCTYTRELTVDLPDLDKADLSEQGEEEYCENCGRPMVLKKGRFGTFFACSGYPDCKTTKQIGGIAEEGRSAARRKVPAVRQQPGDEERPLRRVHRLQQLSHLQVRQAEDHRREVPGMLGRRNHRAPLQEGQDVLRLQSLPRLQVRRLGQARRREVSRVRQPLHDRKVAEGRRRSGSAPTPSASTRWTLLKRSSPSRYEHSVYKRSLSPECARMWAYAFLQME